MRNAEVGQRSAVSLAALRAHSVGRASDGAVHVREAHMGAAGDAGFGAAACAGTCLFQPASKCPPSGQEMPSLHSIPYVLYET